MDKVVSDIVLVVGLNQRQSCGVVRRKEIGEDFEDDVGWETRERHGGGRTWWCFQSRAWKMGRV